MLAGVYAAFEASRYLNDISACFRFVNGLYIVIHSVAEFRNSLSIRKAVLIRCFNKLCQNAFRVLTVRMRAGTGHGSADIVLVPVPDRLAVGMGIGENISDALFIKTCIIIFPYKPCRMFHA